jgi:glycosyltransferase involved in cell wall biosynthesis
MVRRGIEVDIVTTTRPHSEQLFNPLGVRVQAVPCKFIRAWAYAPSLSRTIKDSVQKADLVHLHGLWLFPHFVASRASWQAGKAYVVSPHGMVDSWALSQGKLKKQIYGNLIEWQTLKRAAVIHAVSESEARDIKRLGFTSEVVTIPNGVDFTEFVELPSRSVFQQRNPIIADKTVFLFLGRIHPKKGLDLLLRAFCEVAKVRPNTVLIIAGPDETGYQKQLENYLAEAGQLDKCIFPGMLQSEERLAALAAADVFVLPSYSEGFPIAPIEALAAGLPVILTEACNIPGIEEAGCGIIVRPENDSLSKAMRQLANNPELGKQMGDRGRELVLAKYTWARIASRLTQVYESVLLGKRSGIRTERDLHKRVANDLAVGGFSKTAEPD